MLLCSGCVFEKSDNLIPDYNYTQIFVEKRLSESRGDVEYKKSSDKEEINKIIDLLNSIPVESPGNELESKLNEKGAYILSFWTQRDLDNRTTESVFYLALLQNGHVVYSDYNDQKMRIRLASVKKNPELVKKITEMLFH